MATETETEKTDLETEDQGIQTTEAADDTEYTVDKQMLDQERANARRAREELASVSELYESANESVEALQRELKELKESNEADKARLQAQQQSEQDKLDDMDPDLVDPQVIKNLQTINNALKRQREDFDKEKSELLNRLKTVNDKVQQYEQDRVTAQQKAAHEQAVESVLSEVEETLKELKGITTPGQFRTEAMKIADDLVDKGERKRPENIREGVKLMRECYLQVISRHEKKKKGVSVDGGKSGVTSGVKTSQRKTGSLDDVAADMLKDKSWKED